MPQLGGYDFPVDPERDATTATVLWMPAAAPAVATVMTEPPAEARTDSVVLKSASALSHKESHDGWQALVGDIVAFSTASEGRDHAIAVVIPIDDDWHVRLKAAQRLRDVLIGRRPKQRLTRQRRTRIAQALRTDDARRSGAALRDIATVYYGQDRLDAEPWKTSALKAQTARLARYGEHLTSSGYRQILRGQSVSRQRLL
ncbi:MAG: DUF2285 domain-containing protein [Pseudomonadota bacterium]